MNNKPAQPNPGPSQRTKDNFREAQKVNMFEVTGLTVLTAMLIFSLIYALVNIFS